MRQFVTQIPRFHFSLSPLARKLSGDRPCALWESSQQKQRRGLSSGHEPARFAFLAILPARTFTVRGRTLTETRHGHTPSERELAPGTDPFSVLQHTFSYLQSGSVVQAAERETEFPLAGGLLGFVAYDCGRHFERIRGAEGSKEQPDLFFLEATHLLVQDRRKESLTLISTGPGESELESVHEELIAQIEAPSPDLAAAPHAKDSTPLECSEDFSKTEFAAMVERALEYIRAGDIFQVVLANRFRYPHAVDPFAAYEALRKLNPSPYHFLIRFSDHTLVGASPEVMLQSGEQAAAEFRPTVKMRLVAGTYPRGSDVEQSERQAADLGTDSKELAEHLMLVDHARNDIGRVAEIGSVEVADLFSVETYLDVHHLVSQVSGVLKPGETALSALRSCFPIATLTGTPKIRAMEIIAELETPSRGIFGGAVVALGTDGTIDSAVAIRALVTGPNATSVQAGAGIVYDSSPEREYHECRWKADAVFAAIAESKV